MASTNVCVKKNNYKANLVIDKVRRTYFHQIQATTGNLNQCHILLSLKKMTYLK